MAKHSGKNALVYMEIPGSPATVAQICVTNWSLNQATDKIEVTDTCDENKTYVLGQRDTTGSLNGFWRDDEDALFDGADSDEAVSLYLYPSKLHPSKFWSGTAWVDASIDTGGPNAPVAVAGTFAAAGSWSRQ